MTNKQKQKDKELKLKLLKVIALALTGYLLLNLFIYVTGKINHITFWGSLIVVWLMSWKVIPSLKRKIENS